MATWRTDLDWIVAAVSLIKLINFSFEFFMFSFNSFLQSQIIISIFTNLQMPGLLITSKKLTRFISITSTIISQIRSHTSRMWSLIVIFWNFWYLCLAFCYLIVNSLFLTILVLSLITSSTFITLWVSQSSRVLKTSTIGLTFLVSLTFADKIWSIRLERAALPCQLRCSTRLTHLVVIGFAVIQSFISAIPVFGSSSSQCHSYCSSHSKRNLFIRFIIFISH